MREIPILFSTPMVQAILDGRKTMTRRLVEPQPLYVESTGSWVWPIPKSKVKPCCCTEVCSASREWWEYLLLDQMPYQPGDRLWVRETWAYIDRGFGGDAGGYVYRASENGQLWETETEGWRWRPSIHMPKEAARIWLEVTDVRVERLQDITPNDIAAEGLPSYIIPPGHKHYNNVCGEKRLGYEWFRDLWDSFNSKRGCGWDTNPWVWVISFKRVNKCH